MTIRAREKRAGEEGDFWRTFLPCGLVTAWLAALIVIETDFGTAMMLVLILLYLVAVFAEFMHAPGRPTKLMHRQ